MPKKRAKSKPSPRTGSKHARAAAAKTLTSAIRSGKQQASEVFADRASKHRRRAAVVGRGFLGGWGPLPGPWLEPGFREKGYDDLAEPIAIAVQLIDAFNEMIVQLTAQPEFAHVHYIDLRSELFNNAADYKKWWGNELHPTSRGFDAVTKRFADTLFNLP